MRRVILSLALVSIFAAPLALSAAGLPGEVQTLMRYAPADTDFVVVVPSLERLVDGIRAFGSAIQIDKLASFKAQEILAEPLGGDVEGIDITGPVMMVASAEHPGVLLLARAKSADAWSGNHELEASGSARIFELRSVGVAALTPENVVVIGREAADVRRGLAQGGMKEPLPEDFTQAVGKRQVALWAAVPAWKPRLDETLSFVAQTAYMGMAAAPNAELIIPMYKMFFDQLGQMLGQTESYVAAISIGGEGVFVEQRARFVRDGFVTGYLEKVSPSQQNLLRGLPAGAAMAFACEWQVPESVPSLNEAMARTLFHSEALERKVPAEQIKAALANTAETYRCMSGLSCAFMKAPSEDGWVIYGNYLSAQQKALQESLRRGLTSYPEVMKAWGAVPTADLQHEQETVGGAKADVFHFSFADMESQMQPVVEAMYGKDTAMIIAPSPQGCLYTMGPTRSAREQAKRMLDSAPPLCDSPLVQALMSHFRPQPQAVFFVDIPQWFELIGQVVRKMGMMFPPVDFSKREFALTGGALYLEPDALRLELYVPAPPIQAVMEALRGAAPSYQTAY